MKKMKKMKRIITIVISIAMMLSIVTGCGQNTVNSTIQPSSQVEEAEVKTEEALPEPPSYRMVETRGLKLEIKEELQEVDLGNNQVGYMTEDKSQVYFVNEVSSLGAVELSETYKQLVEVYGEKAELLDSWDTLKDITCSDNTKMKVGFTKVSYNNNGTIAMSYYVMVPDKNLLISIIAQHTEGADSESVKEELTKILESITFTEASEDVITGNTFIASDESEICLKEDGTFRWYRSQDNHEDEYYEGTYAVYRSEEAITKIGGMTEYGVTQEELEEMIHNCMNGYSPSIEENNYYRVCKDNYYAIILKNEKLVQGEVKEYEEPAETLLIGFYVEELKILDLLNCNTGNNAVWSPKEN